MSLEHLKILSGSFVFIMGKRGNGEPKTAALRFEVREGDITTLGSWEKETGLGPKGDHEVKEFEVKLVQHRGNKWKLRSEAQERKSWEKNI